MLTIQDFYHLHLYIMCLMLYMLKIISSPSCQLSLLLILFITWGMNGQSSMAGDVTNSIHDWDSDRPQGSGLGDHLLPSTAITQSPDTTLTKPESTQAFYIREIRVMGSTIFSQKDFAPVVKPFEGRVLTKEEIKQASDAITQLYLNQNYLTSRAVPMIPEAGSTEGVLVIQIIEGQLADIEIRGTKRVNPGYIRSRIQLAASVPLNSMRLEEQLRLLQLDPLFENVQASLRPTGQQGKSLLIVRIEEAESSTTNWLIDNYSPVSVGGERFGLELGYRNLTGWGDLLTGSYYRTFTGGSNVFSLGYQIPVNAMNGTVEIRVAPSRTKITESPFKGLNIEGEQEFYDINYRQPVWRSPRKELAISLGFTHQNGQTFQFDRLPTPFGIGPDSNGVSRTSVIKFGQEYIQRDAQGVWFWRSQFNFGVGLFNATINQDPIPDSRFFSWAGQLQRTQRLSDSNLLLLQANWQFTPDSLLTSQQFVMGGGQSIRGYRQNIRSGDRGLRLGVENRITIETDPAGLPIIQLAPFVDMGVVWNQSDNPNQLPQQNFLAGAGLGFLWGQALGIDGLTMRLDYAIPLVDLQDRGNNIQDQGFYFSLRYQP